MKHSTRTSISLLFCVVAHLAGTTLPARAQDGNFTRVPNQDAAMAAAIARSRASLPDFWKRHASPASGENGFAVKVGVPVGRDDTEHIWVGDVEALANGKYAGKLANDARDFKGKEGDRIEFSEAQISDWLFMRNGKIVGNETLRPLLLRMPKAQADHFRSMLESP